MTVLVEKDGTERATVTLVPGRLGRLFGRRTRRGVVIRATGHSWVWEATRAAVGAAVRRELEAQVVEDVPRATTRRSS